jgi:adenine-specific DNA-methyltransferase
MAKIEVTKTELVWPGKYNEDGSLKEVPRVNLPFQVIETINESRASREAKKVGQQMSLFDFWDAKEGETFEEGWRNKLIWGDNLLVMGSLLDKFAGKIDLIYIDPPFATGADFSFSTELGESGAEITKEQSAIEEKAYRDTWGRGTNSYLSMMYERLSLIRDLLAENGSIYVHCDWRVDSLMRALMDEVFGVDALRNEIIWHYEKWTSPSGTSFQKNHDIILFFAKNKNNFFSEIRHITPNLEEKYKRGYLFGGGGGSRGLVVYNPENPKVKELIASGRYDVVYASKEGKPLSDVWRIPFINPVASERINYPTQKPEALLDRIVRASSKEVL